MNHFVVLFIAVVHFGFAFSFDQMTSGFNFLYGFYSDFQDAGDILI